MLPFYLQSIFKRAMRNFTFFRFFFLHHTVVTRCVFSTYSRPKFALATDPVFSLFPEHQATFHCRSENCGMHALLPHVQGNYRRPPPLPPKSLGPTELGKSTQGIGKSRPCQTASLSTSLREREKTEGRFITVTCCSKLLRSQNRRQMWETCKFNFKLFFFFTFTYF